jgi:hypothetical protein
MQTARLFLISSPSQQLSNVLCHVFADLRFHGKIDPRLRISIFLLIKKMGLQLVPNSPNALFLLASAALSLLSLSPISHSAP